MARKGKDEVVTLSEAAARLGLPRRKLYAWADTGRVPVVRKDGPHVSSPRLVRLSDVRAAAERVKSEAGSLRSVAVPAGHLTLADAAAESGRSVEFVRLAAVAGLVPCVAKPIGWEGNRFCRFVPASAVPLIAALAGRSARAAAEPRESREPRVRRRVSVRCPQCPQGRQTRMISESAGFPAGSVLLCRMHANSTNRSEPPPSPPHRGGPADPTDCVPGSRAKVELMRLRAEKKLPLHIDGDRGGVFTEPANGSREAA